jgi:hypothetical protein
MYIGMTKIFKKLSNEPQERIDFSCQFFFLNELYFMDDINL